jgi:hypothetical protein
MPRHPPYTLKSLTTFIDHRHTNPRSKLRGFHQGVVNGRSPYDHFHDRKHCTINNESISPKRCSTTPARRKDHCSTGWGFQPYAGAGIAEVSSFGLTGSFSRPPLARRPLERPAHPGMNLLLNLKRLHLSKSNKLASLVRRLLAAGSVDEFSRRTRARQPSLTAADLSRFDAFTAPATQSAATANRKLRQV